MQQRKKKKRSQPSPAVVVQELACTTPLNRQQDVATKLLRSSTVAFLLGPAGCGKTHLAITHAVGEVAAGNVEKIILTRPIVEAGESLGYLPGTFSEKVAPYLAPVYDAIEKVAGKNGKRRDQINAAVSVQPIAYLRGRTFDNAVIVVDEVQNCTLSQIKLVLTRLGRGSQIVITGDGSQSDLPFRDRCLGDVAAAMLGLPGVGVMIFDSSSIVRHPILASVIERIEKVEREAKR